MKKKLILGVLLAATLIVSLGFTGCSKTTGGGSFYDLMSETDDFWTFGFNAQPVGEPSEEPIATIELEGDEEPLLVTVYQQGAKGQMSLVNHTEGYKVKVTFDKTLNFTLSSEVVSGDLPVSLFFGPAMIKTQGMENDLDGSYSVIALFEDYSDGSSNPGFLELIIGEGDALEFIEAYLTDFANFDPYNIAGFTVLFVTGGPLEPGSDIVVH
jgi:hypothetical protein